MTAAMDAMGPETAEPLKQSRCNEAYVRIARRKEDWRSRDAAHDCLKIDYDWSAEVARLPIADDDRGRRCDGMPPSHAVEFFGLLAAENATPAGTARA